MAFLDKILNSMKYNDDDDYDDDYYDEEDDYDQRPSRGSVRSIRTATMNDEDDLDSGRNARAAAKQSVPTTPRTGTTRRTANGMEVCVIKPTTVNDAREITETLLSNRTVVLNMEGLDVDIAQRIIDFTSGSTFAMGGNLQKISHYIFIITPKSVDISGDFQEILSGAFDVPALNNRF
ncbi:MAG: cell division protein SepF [Lachnospiraceae bacterium]|nr:cell division protein SepF [Lachnospiraceae bacterium]